MTTWLVPRTELTPDQIRAVELSTESHRSIFGPPGSGKTQVVLHRAAFLRDRNRGAKERYHIFSFTRTLSDYLRSALHLLDIPESAIGTFDSWCYQYFKKNIGKPIPMIANSDPDKKPQPNHARIRDAVFRDATQRCRRGKKLYDFVIVDEGQDFDAACYTLLSTVSHHVTVSLDHKQQIYDAGAASQAILQALDIPKINVSLLDAFRCSPYIVELASAFVENDSDKQAYRRQVRTMQLERETPLLYVAKSEEEEVERMRQILQSRIARGERVGILVPRSSLIFRLGKLLAETGLAVEKHTGKTWANEINFANDVPKIITYHSAKGLTFDTILLPCLTQQYFARYGDPLTRRLLFVGITRAVRWVYMSTISGSEISALTTVRDLKNANAITIQEHSPLLKPPPTTPPLPKSGKPALDDLLNAL